MESPLDIETVKQIRQLGGNRLLTDLVEIFLENTPLRLEELRAGVSEGDMVRAAKAAHSFRSSSISLGARALSDEAASLERLADQGEGDEVRQRLPAFEGSVEALLTHLGTEYRSRS